MFERAYCLHDDECEPGETLCGATYRGFEWRGLKDEPSVKK